MSKIARAAPITLAVALTLATAAYGAWQGAGRMPFPAGEARTATITLQRTACYGSCPIYQVAIEGSGAVRYIGLSNVDVGGLKTVQVDPAQVAALVERFRAADFFALKDHYSTLITDAPTYCLTLTISGRTKTVADYVGRQAGMPPVVTELEDAVDSLAGTSQWIGPRPFRGPAKRYGDFRTPNGSPCGVATLDGETG